MVTMPKGGGIRSWSVVLIIGLAASLTAAFSYENKTSSPMGCMGEKVTLSWQYDLGPKDKIVAMQWRNPFGKRIADFDFSSKSFSASDDRIKQSNASQSAIEINGLSPQDRGIWVLQTTVLNTDTNFGTVFSNPANLRVFEIPSLSGDGELFIRVKHSDHSCDLDRNVTLTCGHFQGQVSEGLAVVWSRPSGEETISRPGDLNQGLFNLTLPSPVPPGRYSCQLRSDPLLQKCLPQDSPLLKPAQIFLPYPAGEGCPVGLGPAQDVQELAESLNTMQRAFQVLRQNVSEISMLLNDVQAQQRRAAASGEGGGGHLDGLNARVAELESLMMSREPSRANDKVSTPDPLTSDLRSVCAITIPHDDVTANRVGDIVITPKGKVVIALQNQSRVLIAESACNAVPVSLPLIHGSSIRALTSVDEHVVVGTVDDYYLFVLNATSGQERWVPTSAKYYGVTARSPTTLYVSVSLPDGRPRIAVVSYKSDTAEELSTLVSVFELSELAKPQSLIVNGDSLYITDWSSAMVVRIELNWNDVKLIRSPRIRPDLTFYQPRRTAFDPRGNMYLATGGRVCGAWWSVSKGFCVVAVTPEGMWKQVVKAQSGAFPMGLVSTPAGFAVSWVFYGPFAANSLVEWYEFQ